MNSVLHEVRLVAVLRKISNVGKTLTFQLVANLGNRPLVHFMTESCILHPLRIDRWNDEDDIGL